MSASQIFTLNMVWTWTEHSEPEQNVQVHVHLLPELNPEIQVQVQAYDPQTWTELDPGQSTSYSTKKHSSPP